MTGVASDNTGGPMVALTQQYDSSGRRTRLAAAIEGTGDFVNAYTYDDMGRVTQISQQGQAGGYSVAEKLV